MKIPELLEKRNRNLGSMFAAEFAVDYLRILYALLQFRREHELEVLRDELYASLKETDPLSCSGETFDLARFDQEMTQLENWGLIEKRLEKTRLRSYKDVRRDRFRFSLTEETVAFLVWLEERHENDLLPHDDDSINLLEFILSSLKQVNRALKNPEENFSIVTFALGDVQEKTAKLTRNLSRINVHLGEFLLRVYSAGEAREIVGDLNAYFRNYLEQLYKLRMEILAGLEQLQEPTKEEALQHCFSLFVAEQQKVPRMMRAGGQQELPMTQIARLVQYYRRNGNIDRLYGAVNENAMKVLGKLTSYLKELERRSNRLEFINLRLQELARQPDAFEAPKWLRNFLASAAAPLDPNDSDEYQKAEPPSPRSGNSAKRTPPRTFFRTRILAEEHVETHEEMRLRLLADFLNAHYSDGSTLSSVKLDGVEDFAQIVLLLKYGILGEGRQLRKIGRRLMLDSEKTAFITGCDGELEGPETTLREILKHE